MEDCFFSLNSHVNCKVLTACLKLSSSAFITHPTTTAQQEAERAKYIVMKANQEKEAIIIKAEGEAQSAALVGKAIKENPAFIKLRKIDAARDIANVVSSAGQKVYLSADSLLLNMYGDDGQGVAGKKR